MITKKIFTTLVVSIAWVSPLLHAGIDDDFEAVNQQRGHRLDLISYLKSKDIAAETGQGFLEATKNAGDDELAIIEAENNDRDKLFKIIAKKTGGEAAIVGSQFALRMGFNPSVKKSVVTLRIHGSNTVGASLAPALVRGFIADQGYGGIEVEKNGVESFITYVRPNKSILGRIEIKAHGSSTAFAETDESSEVGLAGRYCDIGMSSRPIKDKEAEMLLAIGMGDLRSRSQEYPVALDGVAVFVHPDNPVSVLTVDQIAQIFSGEIRNWKELGGPDLTIKLFARDDQSGTYDTFNARVLKATNRSLADSNVIRFEDNKELVRSVASENAGIGFSGLAYVDTSVREIAVQAGELARPFKATRLTIKTQDYPLARLLYFYVPSDATPMARDFAEFAMSNKGQKIVDEQGLVGQGVSTKEDKESAESYRNSLLEAKGIPDEYKKIVSNADRRDTQANIRFLSGSLVPDTNSVNNIDRLVSRLAVADNEDVTVVLVGFADNVGSQSANHALSVERAETVAERFRASGVRRIEVAGFGEAMPVADNRTEEGRAANRRVEIWLKR